MHAASSLRLASLCAVTLLVRVHDVAQPAPGTAPAVSVRPAASLDDAGYATVAVPAVVPSRCTVIVAAPLPSLTV